MNRLISLAYFVYFFLTAALLSFMFVLLLPFSLLFDRSRRLMHMLNSMWGYHFVKLNPFWDCEIEGSENLSAARPCVIVANHQSLADIFVLSGLTHPFKWVSKDSLLRIPFFGWNMSMCGYVGLKRGDGKSIREMMAACRQWLRGGSSIMMFPEGTRSPDGRIARFRGGSFRLALECAVPLVPVVVSGTREVIAKHGRCLNLTGKIRVKILPAVAPESFAGNPAAMRDHVRAIMAGELDRLNGV